MLLFDSSDRVLVTNLLRQMSGYELVGFMSFKVALTLLYIVIWQMIEWLKLARNSVQWIPQGSAFNEEQ